MAYIFKSFGRVLACPERDDKMGDVEEEKKVATYHLQLGGLRLLPGAGSSK